jgi:hypothetical protein
MALSRVSTTTGLFLSGGANGKGDPPGYSAGHAACFPDQRFSVQLWLARIALAVTLLELEAQPLEVFAKRITNQC